MESDAVRALLPHLPLLEALAEDEHVTHAAELLGVPQPTVSRALRALSTQLGIEVVQRSGRGIRLSPAIRAIMPSVRLALRAVRDAADSLEAARSTVGVSFQNSLGERLVPTLIRAVRERHPDIVFRLHQGSRGACLIELDAGRYDIALVSGIDAADAQFETLHLYDEPLVVVVPAGHPFARRDSVRIADLLDQPQAVLKPGYGLRQTVDRLFGNAARTPRIAFEGDELRTLHGLVAAGLGVAIGPAVLHPMDGCVQVPILDADAVRDMGAVYRSGEAPAVRAVLDAVVDITRNAGPRAFALT